MLLYFLRPIVRLFDNLKFYCRVGIADTVQLNFQQEKADILIGVVIQPFDGSTVFFTSAFYDPNHDVRILARGVCNQFTQMVVVCILQLVLNDDSSVCSCFGSINGSKLWHSTDKYKRTIWQCNHKFDGDERCSTPTLYEDDIKARFVMAVNALITDKETVLDICRLMQSTLSDCSGIDTELEELMQEVAVVTEMTKRCIDDNSRTAQDQDEFAARYNGLVERYETAKGRIERLQAQKAAREEKADILGAFMFELHEKDGVITEFDDRLWIWTVEKVTVHSDGRLVFTFFNGQEITS